MTHELALISSNVLRALPALLSNYCNDAAVSRVFKQAGLSENVLNGRDIYITQRSQLAFMQAAARELGEQHLGLLLAPHITINNYGVWGKYILSGTTLQNALQRTVDVMKYYSTHDLVSFRRDGDDILFSHSSASAGIPEYQDIAPGTAAAMVDVVGFFLGRGWKPAYIELDIPDTNRRDQIEDVLGCPVRLGASEINIPVPIDALGARQRDSKSSTILTRADVVREARGAVPKNFPDAISEIIRTQLMCGQAGLETIAFELQIGPRKLQRELEKESTSYRDLLMQVRTERAKELLLTDGINITQISGELGYSSPTHFSRAFSSATGISPSRFRKLQSMLY